MVSSARVGWIVQQLHSGRQAIIKMATFPDRVVLHVVLLPNYSNDSRMRNWMAIACLRTVSDSLLEAVCVDHGHGKSNGESHCSFVLKPTPDISERHANVPGYEQEAYIHPHSAEVQAPKEVSASTTTFDAVASGLVEAVENQTTISSLRVWSPPVRLHIESPAVL